MVRYVKRVYDELQCDDFTALAPGNPLGEVCELLLTEMANVGMVVPAATLAVREYNAGVRAAQRHGARHNDARNGYSRGKYWAERALEEKIDPDGSALRLAREVRDTVVRIETGIANQDRATAAIVDFFGKALSGPSVAQKGGNAYQQQLERDRQRAEESHRYSCDVFAAHGGTESEAAQTVGGC
jgi:hypothetical protein